jgi:RHS repeat-associated protein
LPLLGTCSSIFHHDARGNRDLDDNQTSGFTKDDRTYTYDGRRNVINVRGQYKLSGTWRYYNVASAFDAKNRRVFKSFYDETLGQSAQWFFYYDPHDRLTEVRHTPDISSPNTYSIVQLAWLGGRLAAYWQTDYPSATSSKRYVTGDETNRPVDMNSWVAGASSRVWAITPSAWGVDSVLTGAGVFQPIAFSGQYRDDETCALFDDASEHRPGLAENRFRSYDPWTGSYVQGDPLVDASWSTYVYAEANPVGNDDPDGRMMNMSTWCVGVSLAELSFSQVIACLNGEDDPGPGGGSGSGGPTGGWYLPDCEMRYQTGATTCDTSFYDVGEDRGNDWEETPPTPLSNSRDPTPKELCEECRAFCSKPKKGRVCYDGPGPLSPPDCTTWTNPATESQIETCMKKRCPSCL